MSVSNARRKELREINKLKLQNIIPVGTKVCNKCHEEKDVGEFNKDYGNKDGINRWCKQCQSEHHKLTINKVIYIDVETKICANCGLKKDADEFWRNNKYDDGLTIWCKDCYREWRTQSYFQQQYDINKVWSKENLDKYQQCLENYRKSEEGRIADRELKARRNAMMQQLPYTLTDKEWRECLEYFDYSCAYCGNDKNIQHDHFVSVFNYGPYTKENIVVACNSCNPSKNDNDFFEWYPKQDFYDKGKEEKILNYLWGEDRIKY